MDSKHYNELLLDWKKREGKLEEKWLTSAPAPMRQYVKIIPFKKPKKCKVPKSTAKDIKYSNLPDRILAKRHGVSKSTIRRIKNGLTYPDI